MFALRCCTLPSCDPLDLPFFMFTPAANPENELFFVSTMDKLGRIVQDDVKLGTLYITLILATPGAELSEKARVRMIGFLLFHSTVLHLV